MNEGNMCCNQDCMSFTLEKLTLLINNISETTLP